jgi:hypothetical protein
LEYLGLEKHEWLVEVAQKFNVLAVLNSIFREGLLVYAPLKKAHGEQQSETDDQEDEDEVFINKKASNLDNGEAACFRENFLERSSLAVIKD